MIINAECYAGENLNAPPEFTYSSDVDYLFVDEGEGNWHIEFFGSGTLEIKKLNNAANGVDIYIVGGGATGVKNGDWYDSTYGSGWNYTGGAGGASAYTTTKKGESISTGEHQVVIGSAGGTSSIFGYSAAGGSGQSTGKRAGGGGTCAGSSGKGTDGEYAFAESTFASSKGAGYKFAASGSGGSGSRGGGAWKGSTSAAGATEGGKGGTGTSKKGSAAGANSGSGGGGAGGNSTAGAGGSGIIIIRNAR